MKLFVRLSLFSFCILSLSACRDGEPKQEPESKEVSKETSIEGTKYHTKGTMLSDGGENTSYFLKTPISSLEATAYNRRTDSLLSSYATDQNAVSTLFALGTHWATVGDSSYMSCDSAVTFLSKAIDQNPSYEDFAAYFNRASAHLCLGNIPEATADIASYLEGAKEPAASALLIQAKIALNTKDYEKVCAFVTEYKKNSSNWDSTLKVYEKTCQE